MYNLHYKPDFNRTLAEQQAFMMFCICAAGKNADNTVTALNRLFSKWHLCYCSGDKIALPFDYIKHSYSDGFLLDDIKKAGLGCYNHRYLSFISLLSYPKPINEGSIEDYQTIYGVGPKTARFFVLFTRPNETYAILDTHILKFLKWLNLPAPNATPSSEVSYKFWENTFIRIWKAYFKEYFDTLDKFDYYLWSHIREGDDIWEDLKRMLKTRDGVNVGSVL